MIRHIALFAFAECTSDRTEEFFSVLSDFPQHIPEVVDLTWGRSFSDRAGEFTHAAILSFQDREALQGFLDHPAHQHFATTLVQPLTTELLIVDFEDPGCTVSADGGRRA